MDTDFTTKVFNITKQIPKGKVCTYKLIAIALKKPGASQAVGRALASNTNPKEIPCHRVLCSNGKISGYFGSVDDSAINKRIKILEKEGLAIKDGKVVDLKNVLYTPLVLLSEKKQYVVKINKTR